MELQDSVLTVPVLWRGKKLEVEINSEACLKDFGDELQKLSGVKADTMRLIVPQSSGKNSNLLMPFSNEHSHRKLNETTLMQGKSIRMMGVSEDEVNEVIKSAQVDLRIAGFEEDERRMRQRMSSRPNASLKLPQGPYIFCDFRTLELPGIMLNPPASEALKRMHMLAADPGIVAIMNKHRWRVGIMTEMAPVGYVGVSPTCVLGLNKNKGQEISLRLRTDDLKGFRKYESIKKTLLHELAHMVHSEHDANFYALDRQLNQEASTLDWTKSAGRTLTRVRPAETDDMEIDLEFETATSHRLGGKTDMPFNARAASVAAAYHRFTDASDSHVLSETNKDPSPAEQCGEAQAIDAMRTEMTDFENQRGNEVKLEPDPDDSKDGAEIKNRPVAVSEPDPDDLEATEFQSILDDEGVDGCKMHEEPDRDDQEVSAVAVESSSSSSALVTTNCSKNTIAVDEPLPGIKALTEPDPDDTETSKDVQGQRNADDDLDHLQDIPKLHLEEPDPDDVELQRIQDPVTQFCNRLTKAVELLCSEVKPTEAVTVLQTLSKIIRNVIEHPTEIKYKKLRKANRLFQQNVANYKAAVEILVLVGFHEELLMDEIGMSETYMVLKRNDPGLLWLAKSSLETFIAE